jgi:hypothetical protein
MSVLNKDLNELRPDPAKRAARDLLRQTQHTFEMMSNAFNEGARRFWQNNDSATPEQIALELGTDAVEVFQLHAKLGALLAEVNPESVQHGLEVVGNFTMNEDGTVTVLPTPEPSGI